MKNIQIIGLVIITLSSLFIIEKQFSDNNGKEFEKWKAQFGFSFTNKEDSYRSMIFLENLKEIQEHNLDTTQTYQKGLNHFSHLTKAEFAEIFLNRFYKSQPQSQTKANVQSNVTPFGHSLREVDWQSLGKINPIVGNQGNCDAGYSFCSAGLAESLYLFKNQNISLSKQQIVDCASKYTTFGCSGGSRNGTLTYIRQVGLNAEKDYPWKGTVSNCQITKDGDYKPKYTHVQFNGCTDIQSGLYLTPLTVAVNAKDWQSYRSGVYNGCTSNQVTHDILLVGVNSQGWRLKNSWSTRWGQNGYIRLAAGNMCGICEKPGFGFKI